MKRQTEATVIRLHNEGEKKQQQTKAKLKSLDLIQSQIDLQNNAKRNKNIYTQQKVNNNDLI